MFCFFIIVVSTHNNKTQSRDHFTDLVLKAFRLPAFVSVFGVKTKCKDSNEQQQQKKYEEVFHECVRKFFCGLGLDFITVESKDAKSKITHWR